MCIPRDPSPRLTNIPNFTTYYTNSLLCQCCSFYVSIRQSTMSYHSCRPSSNPNPCTLHSSIRPPLAVTMLLGSLFPRDRPSSVIPSLP